MPKKRRQHFESFKPSSAASPASHSASGSNSDKQQQSHKSVNDLLANLRRTSLGQSALSSSSSSAHQLSGNTPSVPPDIREILQIPETPAPAPRRAARGAAARSRFDHQGRRLPAGPPPPRSWVSRATGGGGGGWDDGSAQRRRPLKYDSSDDRSNLLPDTYLPEPGSLVDVALRQIASDWEVQRDYNRYHLFFLPNHLKPALIRLVGLTGGFGVTASDLKAILLPAPDAYEQGELDLADADFNREVTYLDLSGSLGRSIKVKEVADLLFPSKQQQQQQAPENEEVFDSWDAAEESSATPSAPRVLLPNLTHLSLALDPQNPSGGSWRQLLSLASAGKLSTVTHLSLAYWPDPCLTPRAAAATISSPQQPGRAVPYAGTGYYSHSLDNDWSEALLVLRMLSRSMYEVEFLDLTGCASWFKALYLDSGHDYVDWAGSWGKISGLRLRAGWRPNSSSGNSNSGGGGENASSRADREAFREAFEHARRVERHIRSLRAGQGRFITVEKDKLDV